MDYEQKYEQKYREALGWMRSLYDGLHGATKEDAEHYFPELKESEDERIRREIIDFLRLPHPQFVGKRDHEKWIAWLEKQGKKPTDKVEPKTIDANKVINWVNPDKVIEWLKNTIREVEERLGEHGIYYNTQLVLPYNSIEDLINDFKEDFGL